MDSVRVGNRVQGAVNKYGHMKFNNCLCVKGDFNKSIKGGFKKSNNLNRGEQCRRW